MTSERGVRKKCSFVSEEEYQLVIVVQFDCAVVRERAFAFEMHADTYRGTQQGSLSTQLRGEREKERKGTVFV